MVLLGLQQRKEFSEITANTKYAIMSEDKKNVLILGKQVISIRTSKLDHLVIRLKSTTWGQFRHSAVHDPEPL